MASAFINCQSFGGAMGWFSRKNATHKDPVCGMEVQEGKEAGKETHAGTAYFFCSASCLQKFKANPSKYAQAKAAP